MPNKPSPLDGNKDIGNEKDSTKKVVNRTFQTYGCV